MGDALSWVPWWLLLAVVVLVVWLAASLLFAALWSLTATLVKRAARRRRCRHIRQSLRDFYSTPEGRAWADDVLADVKRRSP